MKTLLLAILVIGVVYGLAFIAMTREPEDAL
jgi:hypothetical protein